MTQRGLDRRDFLRLGGALSLFGAAAPLAWQMAASSAASAAGASDYKALVCVFLMGGNDGANTLLATDPGNWSQYTSARTTALDSIALMPPGTAPTPVGKISPVTGTLVAADTPPVWGGVLPITPKTPQPTPAGSSTSSTAFALHPMMGPMQTLFQQGRMAAVANVGTLIQPVSKAAFLAGSVPLPPNLFSHNDQQAMWQSRAVEGDKVGWGGAVADVLLSSNGANSQFTATAPYGAPLFLTGVNAQPYVVNTGSLPAIKIATNYQSAQVSDATSTSDIANDYAGIVTKSINAATLINNAVSQGGATTIGPAPTYANPAGGATPANPFAVQLQMVARLIASAQAMGLSRQVYYVCVEGFDTHCNQNATQPYLLGQLAQALAWFDTTLANLPGQDLSGSVTTFTVSEFGRTFTSNGTGTDHAWGSHQFVVGGAVNGGDIYGTFPTLGIDKGSFYNPNMAGNVQIPTTSVDQYGATLAAWLGAPPATIAAIFPNLANFASANLGFV